MKILGIDPGTGILGYGVIEVTSSKISLVEAGVISTPPHTAIEERLEDIFDNLNQIIKQTKPDIMSIEKLFFTRNITTAISVAQARGVAILAGQKAKLAIHEYTPLQIKQTLTGYGKADKKQVQAMVQSELKLKKPPQPDDCADALAAAITDYYMTRLNLS